MNEKDNWWVRREIDLTRQKKINSVHRQDMTMSELNDDLVDWVGPIEIPPLTAKKIDFQKSISNDLKIKKLEINNKKISVQFAEKGGIENIFSKKHSFIKNNTTKNENK